MVDTVFGSIAEAVRAKRRGVLLYVRIGGYAVKATEAHIVHNDKGIGQATVYLVKPVPDVLAFNATLEIEIGNPGTVRRRFYGFIPKWSKAVSDRGVTLRVSAVGWLSYLNYADADGTALPGPRSLKDVFRSLCRGRNVPGAKADNSIYVSGDTIMLGGNEAVDGGDIRFGPDTSPNNFLQQVAPLFGYRVHDNPDGQPRLSRVSGIPIPRHTVGALTYLHNVGDYATPTTTVNVRTGPGTSNPIVGGAIAGQLYRVLDGPVVNNSGSTQNHWYKVAALNGPTGWSGTRNSLGVALTKHVDLLEPLFWFSEGGSIDGRIRTFGWDTDRSDIVTYVEVVGKTYTGLDGGKNQPRSIPAEVLPNDDVAPQTYVHEKFSSNWLVTDEQVEGARNAYEVDLGAPRHDFSWTAGGRADVQVADIGVLISPTWELLNQTVWITEVRDDVTDRGGWVQSFQGWYGGGQALPAGDDCVYKTIATGPIHVGNQTISYYAHPAPQSTLNDDDDMQWSIGFTVEDADYSSIRIEGEAHGSNTYNEKTVSEGSRIEIWQRPDPSAPDARSS
jgi:hypothetical protein